jgi:hypothetical protein
MLLFYILQKKLPKTKVAYFSKIYYHTLSEDNIIRVSSVASTSQAHVSAMLLLKITGMLKKYEFGLASNDVTFIPNFIKIGPAVETCGHTDFDTIVPFMLCTS